MNIYNELMIGLGIGLSVGGSISYYLVSGWLEDYATKEKNYKLEMFAGLKQTRKMQLDKVVKNTHCVNPMIIKVSNGGGMLSDGKDWYSSVVAESPETRDASLISDWQDVPVEDAQKILIKELRRQKITMIKTDDMQGGAMRTTYEALGFIASMQIELYSDPYYYYYMLFPVRENWHLFTMPVEQNLVKNICFSLQKKYQTYSELDILKYDKLH